MGRYISPTIHSYEERFQIDGKEISPDKLEMYSPAWSAPWRRWRTRRQRRIMRCQDSSRAAFGFRGQPLRLPTLFEVETALAFLYFAEEGVDFALIETGMGGTCDATNVIEHPMLTVISSISYDHKAFLGIRCRRSPGRRQASSKSRCRSLCRKTCGSLPGSGGESP